LAERGSLANTHKNLRTDGDFECGWQYQNPKPPEILWKTKKNYKKLPKTKRTLKEYKI